jgi:hypothetical protein
MPFNIQNSRPFVGFPFGLNIQKGLIEDFSAVGQYGYNPSVSTSFVTIWGGSGNYVYPTTAHTITATSSNTGADNGGTILVNGLDSNYNQISETITIGGSASTNTFIRVFSARMLTATTGNANVGDISILNNSLTVAIIRATYGSNLSAVYTVPANKRAFIISASIGMSKQKEIEAVILTKGISNGNVWNTVGYQTTFGVPVFREFPVPILVDQKTDIEMRAKADATTAVSGSFSLYLEDYH